jgi:ribosome-associated protein
MNYEPATRQNYKIQTNISHYSANSLFLLPMIEFKVTGDYIPMIQLLKAANLVSTGGEAQIVVTEGEVMYNGHVDYRKRLKVKRGDTVEFRGETIRVI